MSTHTQHARALLKQYEESGEDHLHFASGPTNKILEHIFNALEEAEEENKKIKERVDKLEKLQPKS
jgi:hypothetical protein